MNKGIDVKNKIQKMCKKITENKTNNNELWNVLKSFMSADYTILKPLGTVHKACACINPMINSNNNNKTKHK